MLQRGADAMHFRAVRGGFFDCNFFRAGHQFRRRIFAATGGEKFEPVAGGFLVFGLSLPFSVFSAGAFNLISNWCHWLSRPADVAAGGDFFGRFIGRLSVVLFYLIGDRASDAAHPGMAEPVFYACRT